MKGQSLPTILVVDDDVRILESMGSLLEVNGYVVSLHSSPQLLLNSEQSEIGACLITDLDMPAMDGFELSRRLRLANPHLPVIFITARRGLHDQERADRFGNHGLFQKPFDAEALLNAVKRAVFQKP